MDQTVTLLVTAVCLLGTALGLRYNVHVLVPAGLAVLIISALAQLIWKQTAGWGVLGMLALLVVLNAGFVLGLFLRAGAALLGTRKIAVLFARPAHADQSYRRTDALEREASIEGADPIAPSDLANESFRR